jgi:hypothetical protein
MRESATRECFSAHPRFSFICTLPL